MGDELSYDVFAQAAQALKSPGTVDPLRGLDVERILAIGASQSAGRMTVYYNVVLPQEQSVFDGYAFIVGSAPSRIGPEPIIQVLSETDVTNPATRRPDSDVFRRWEVAGAAHSGWEGQEYRAAPDSRFWSGTGLQLHESAMEQDPPESADRGGLRSSRALGGRRSSTAARSVSRVQRGRRRCGMSSRWRKAASSCRRSWCRPR